MRPAGEQVDADGDREEEGVVLTGGDFDAVRVAHADPQLEYNVFPLDDRRYERFNPAIAGRPDLPHGRTSMTFYPGMTHLMEMTVLNVKNCSHTITAEVEMPKEGANGVILAQGGRFAGWSLYVKDGAVKYCYNFFDDEFFYVGGQQKLPSGTVNIRYHFDFDGGEPGAGGQGTLQPDGGIDEVDPPDEVPAHDVVVLQPYGSLFFASAPILEQQLPTVTEESVGSVVILRLRGKPDIGSTLIGILVDYAVSLEDVGSKLMIVTDSDRVIEQLERTGATETIGDDDLYRGGTRLLGTVIEASSDAQDWVVAQLGREDTPIGETPIDDLTMGDLPTDATMIVGDVGNGDGGNRPTRTTRRRGSLMRTERIRMALVGTMVAVVIATARRNSPPRRPTRPSRRSRSRHPRSRPSRPTTRRRTVRSRPPNRVTSLPPCGSVWPCSSSWPWCGRPPGEQVLVVGGTLTSRRAVES